MRQLGETLPPKSRVASRWAVRVTKGIASITRTRGAGLGLVWVLFAIFVALAASLVAPYDPGDQDYDALRQPPSVSHPFGTDHVGRDILSRVAYGARVSLSAGIIAVGLAVVVGVLAGLVSGYFSGWIDSVIMRIADAIWSFPTLVLALTLTAILGPSLRNVMIAVGIVFTPIFARLARAETLSVREREFTTAARSVGAPTYRILLVHILPNIAASIIVQATLMVSSAILIEAGLSFLGVGVRPPTPSWGSDLRDGSKFLRQAWWMSVFPGAAIFVTVLAINLLGDGVRWALDPRFRRGSGV